MQTAIEVMCSPMNEQNQESIPTRHSLLNRLKDWGDDASWREFFETYWELIYNVARKAGLTESEAQEVVQETIIGVAKKIGDFETDARRGSFKAWLLQQTRWRIGDQFRKRSPWEKAPNESLARPSDETGTATEHRIPDPASLELDHAWDGEWERHVMRRALEKVKAQVSVKQFQMFDLNVLQGLSVTAAARTLGVNIASIYMAKMRVGRLLKAEVRRLKRESEK